MNFIRLSREDLTSLPPRPAASSPVRLPAASAKKRFKLGRKTSDGSQQSGSSGSSTRSVESVGVAIRQPSKSRIRRHTNRLSGVFLRSPASSPSLTALSGGGGLRSSLSGQSQKGSMKPGDTSMEDDPAELSNQITAPGILKIFGSEICRGAHYKSVLATTHSSARELVKEALERYGLGKEEAGSYVLCDAIGSIDHQWRTEGFRVVGDNEKPLLLQSLWKPREGLARRFEIQRRSTVEEERSKEEDTVTAGINAQARKLQKSRSRVTSTFIERTMGRACSPLWRSKSEMDLTDGLSATETQQNHASQNQCPNQCPDDQTQNPAAQSAGHNKHGSKHNGQPSLQQNHNILSQIQIQTPSVASTTESAAGPGGADTEALCPPPRQRATARERETSEREETESSDDSAAAHYSIHPPHDCPYLLLLQGYSHAQDFLIYLLAEQSTVIGRGSETEEGSKVDLLLFAPDILPRHSCLHRHGSCDPTLLRPCEDAVVTRNGEACTTEVELSPGDVIGLGRHYLFLFKDPLTSVATHQEQADTTPASSLSAVPWLLGRAVTSAAAEPPTARPALCDTCVSARADTLQSPGRRRSGTPAKKKTKSAPFLKDPDGHNLTLSYAVESEDRIVRDIVALGRAGATDRPALTVAFLLCVCVQHSAAQHQTSDLRRLLLLIAGEVQSAMWDHTKEFAAVQPEGLRSAGPDSGEPQQALSLEEVTAGLRPLVVWMSTGLELLNFVQQQLPLILAWRTRREQGKEDEEEREEEENLALLELRLSCVRSACEETMTVLEEVVMLTFQQCVYYITKVLYPILPGILDSNPFREGTEPQTAPAQGVQALGNGVPQVPGETEQVLEVLTETRRLLLDCHAHPDISSQLLAYIFYFINASLFNSLMERGSEAGFYQWSRGVCMRASLDLLLDWAQASGAGLGELALEHTHTLSSAVNLLATPRENLLQTSWLSLRSDFSALSEAQLHHLLSAYSPASPRPHTWAPCPQDQPAAHKTADVLESFDTHHPLVLPGRGYHLELRRAVTDPALRKQLDTLREIISALSDSQPHCGDTVDRKQQSCALPMEAKLIKMDVLPKASLESLDSAPVDVALPQPAPQGHAASASPESAASALSSPPSSSPSALCLDEFGSGGALILSQKLRSLKLQSGETKDTGGLRKSALDPSCLLTPPNTPTRHNLELVNPEKEDRDKKKDGYSHAGEDPCWSSGVDLHDEGGFVSECLAALMTDRLRLDSTDKRGTVSLKEEAEEGADEMDEEEGGDEYDSNDEEVFSLELERGERGLGLALVDARDTPLRLNGIFIRAVVPDSPAAQSEKLVPGDRILAINGISLLGLDYHRGKELIQTSGERPRLLVARSDWTAKALQSKC